MIFLTFKRDPVDHLQLTFHTIFQKMYSSTIRRNVKDNPMKSSMIIVYVKLSLRKTKPWTYFIVTYRS